MKNIILTKTFYNNKLILNAKFKSGFLFCKGECFINSGGYLKFTFRLPKILHSELVEETIVDISVKDFSVLNESIIYDYYKQAKNQWISKNPSSADVMVNYHNEKANKWKTLN